MHSYERLLVFPALIVLELEVGAYSRRTDDGRAIPVMRLIRTAV